MVTGMHSAVAPEWRSTYVVNWEPEGDEPFEEHLALKTIQSYYSADDCYVNEEWVQDEIRILQSLDWRENKLPKEDSEEWFAALDRLNGKQGGRSKAAVGRKKATFTTPKHVNQLANGEPSNQKDTQPNKAAVTSGRSSIGRAVQCVTSIPAAALRTLNATSARFQEAPQALGQAISDVLPSSSKKVSSGRPAASSGTTSAAKTDNVKRAQDTIHAISQSPGKASGSGKRAAAGQAQGSPPPKRSSRHATTAAVPVVVVEDSEVVVDIDGDEAAPQKDVRPSGASLQRQIDEIASGLQAAPGRQTRTSRSKESKGGSFKATGLLQQAEEDGQNGAASPAEPDAASADQQEDMVNLPGGWQPAQIPQRVMAQPGDVPVEEYTAEEYENDAEYEVDSIVAEKKIGRITVYLVKWKGFAINPEEITPRSNLKDCEALDSWEQAKTGASPVQTRSAQKDKKKKKSSHRS